MGAKVRKHRFNIGRKMYIFVIITVLMAAIGITVLAYFINVNQIDTYFKNLAKHSAENFATMVDPNFLDKLRKVAKSEDYQKMREEAEENEDEAAVEAYLKKRGLVGAVLRDAGKAVQISAQHERPQISLHNRMG